MFSHTVDDAVLLDLEKLSTIPGFPLIFAYVSSELSVTNTSATSSSSTTPMPLIPVSKSTSDFISFSLAISSPTRTIYLLLSSSETYPAGIEKFCAVSIADTESSVTALFISDLSFVCVFCFESSSIEF